MKSLSYTALSDEQRSVVDCRDRHIVVLASAGSGKTEVLAQRVERLLDQTEADFRVLALSYTRRAASEMRERFQARLGARTDRVDTDTLHGFCQGLLLKYGTWIGLPADFAIVTSEADRVELIQTWLTQSGKEQLDDPLADLRRLDLNRAVGNRDPLEEEWDSALVDVGAVDYEAMLTRATELLDVPAVRKIMTRLYRYVVVDEAQNLTRSQYLLLRSFMESSDSLNGMMVGDDKQSIVGFAGASIEHLKSYVRHFNATELRLSFNFRSAEEIVRLGQAVAMRLGDRPSGETQKYAAAGSVERLVFDDEKQEALGIVNWVTRLLQQGIPSHALSPSESPVVRDAEIAVLGRSAAALGRCESAMQSAGIAVARSTHEDDWLTSDLGRLIWLVGTYRPTSVMSRRRMARALEVFAPGPRDDLSVLLSSLGYPNLSKAARHESPDRFIDAIQDIDFQNDPAVNQDIFEINELWLRFCDSQRSGDRGWQQFEMFVSKWQRGGDTEPGVRLQTVHKSQGREFKAVALVGLNDGQFPDFRATNSEQRMAELRAFYVAISRPSRVLLLTRPRQTMTRNGSWDRSASEFFTLKG